jgi:hypothetical protein
MIRSVICILHYREICHRLSMGARSRPWEAAWLTKIWRSSAASTKRKGDRGSPCLTPLLHLKNFPGIPLSRTAVQAEFRMLVTHRIQLSGKPRLDMICNITWCSTKSNAFSKSSFRMVASLLDWWHWWMYSKHQAKQSWIVLDLIKPYWFLWINPIISVCSLSARILVTNFGATFISEIGL